MTFHAIKEFPLEPQKSDSVFPVGQSLIYFLLKSVFFYLFRATIIFEFFLTFYKKDKLIRSKGLLSACRDGRARQAH
jgi:uncharacterized membrane protein